MNPRNTGVLLLATLAFGAFLYFYEIGGEEERKAAEQAASNVFPDLEADDVSRIELTAGDGTPAVVERAEAGWRLREPVDFPGDAATLDGLASTLSGLSSEAVIDEPQEAAVYGLDDGAERVRFVAAGDSYELRVGSRTPVGASSYLGREGDARVFIVPTWRVTSLKKELVDLRDRKVLDFDRANIDRVEASWRGGSVTLEKRDDIWWLSQPVEGKADPEVVDDLLSDLAFLRADGFEDDPRPDPDAGLDDPEFFAALSGADAAGGEVDVRFALGSLIEGGERLARGRSPGLYRVAGDRLQGFPRRVVSYRFKDVSTFATAEAKRFELSFRDGEERSVIEGSLEDGEWSTSPERMDPELAANLLSELSRLKGVEILADDASEDELASHGLAPAEVEIRVLPGDDDDVEALAHVALGTLDPEGIAVRDVDSRQVFRIALDLAEHIPVGLGAFRNRFLAAEEPIQTDETAAADEPERPDGPGADGALGVPDELGGGMGVEPPQ